MTEPATTTRPKETRAGNYFVANYPPFSFWSPETVPAFLDALDRPPAPDTPLGLYVHIPFCRKRCHFCYFRVYTGVKSQEIRAYVDAALHELDMYRGRAFLGDRPLRFIYFGGGTPSFLSTAQLQTFAEGLKAVLPWDEAEEITFECEPGTLNEKKLQFIRDLGVTRLSLGVENFDSDILEANGRAHRADEVFRAYDFARQCAYPQINIDLIAGMMNETDENWVDCVQKAIELDPDSITIYQMEIPYNTTIYKQMQDAGKVTAPVADWETKRRWVHYAFEQLEQAGYDIGSAYTAVKKDRGVTFTYRDELWRGADLLALGVASFGHVNGIHYQNEHDMDGYLERLQREELPVHRALIPTDEERLIREFVLQFKLGSVDQAYFRKKFDVDVAKRFREPLDRLAEWGFLRGDADKVTLNRDGLLEVDRLLHEFFLPQHRDARYA